MIRFIDLQDQICEGTNEFAFWDTTVDRFCTFNDSQTWESVEEFVSDFEADWEEQTGQKIIQSLGDNWDYSLKLNRYLGLIPHDWNFKCNLRNDK